jgi:AcrR family transcriptional regulator
MGRPRIHDDNTRQRLLRAAEAAVALGGAEALSVRHLAEVAETTTRAVYSVFGGKEGIVRALQHESWVILRHRVAAVSMTADPAEDLVRAGLEAFRWFATNHPNLFRLTFEGRLPFSMRDDLAAAVDARAELRRLVQRCADADRLGGRAAELVTSQFHALCQGLASNELAGWFARFGDPVLVWEGALRALVQGMVPPNASPQRRPSRKRSRGR